MGFVTQVTLARMYGPTLLGLYVLGTTIVSGANVLAEFGMDNGVVRYVAHYRAGRDSSRVRGVIMLALWVTFSSSLVLAVLMFFGAGFLANTVFDKPALEGVFRVFSVSVPFLTVMSIALWATQGFQTVKYQTFVQEVLRPSINLLLVVVFYILGAQIFGAVAANVISMAAGAALAFYYLKRVFPKLLDSDTPPTFESRAVFSVSGPMAVVNITRYINSWVTVLVVGVFATADAVGIYNVASRTAALSALVLAAFSGIFNPLVSSLHSRGLRDDLGRLYKDVSRWVFTGSLAIFVLTALLSRDIMAVFGDEFVPGRTAMVLIAIAQLFNSSVGPTNRVLAMTGHQKVFMLTTLVSAVTGLVGSLMLVPLYGVLGAAVAAASAIVLANATALLSIRRLLSFWPYSYQYLKPLVAGLLAGCVTFFLKLALPLPEGIPTILVLSPLFLAGFAVALLALGLSSSDRQFLNAFWTAVRRIAIRDSN